MKESEIMELLEGISSDEIELQVEKLNGIGIITDVEEPLFPHMIMKNWKSSHDAYLRNHEHSYQGGLLFAISENDLDNSPIFTVYDTDKYDMDTALEYVRKQDAENSKNI